MNKGIDYGRGLTNIDLSNNIRNGVIPINHVMQSWADSSEPVYPEMIEVEEGEEDFIEPSSFIFEEEGYSCEADETDIFICKSPYYTYAQFCSPCAPGACYLPNPIEDKDSNNKCYCFGHDWFEEGIAPYKVYDVKTDKEVLPE